MTASRNDEIPSTLPQLILPKRFEILEREAKNAGLNPSDVVERVDDAARRVESLLRQVRDGGTGLFEVFFGHSGAGKTTFLQTLPKFFEHVRVIPIEGTVPLMELEQQMSLTFRPEADAPLRLFVLKDRDNARVGGEEAEDFFEMLRRMFRTAEGQVLVIWPVTRDRTREVLARVAWETGAESVVPLDTKGVYHFVGLPKERFPAVASITVSSLNGEALDGYGVSPATATRILEESETISQFYTKLEADVAARRQRTWQVLKEKVRPRVWVVVSGDDSQYIAGTVASLSQGRRARIDLELLLDFLDDKKNDAVYLEKWRQRRDDVGYLMRTLDVRLVTLPPSPALAAVRAFGSESLRERLKKQTEPIDSAVDAVSRSQLFKSLLEEVNISAPPFVKGRPPSQEAEDEYLRIQQTAAADDKPLNRALGGALDEALRRVGAMVRVLSEKRDMPGTNLQPDVQIWLNDSEVICLEPTWRTSGRGIVGEIEKSQNSMSPGHIQKYLLAKVYDYVTALGL